MPPRSCSGRRNVSAKPPSGGRKTSAISICGRSSCRRRWQRWPISDGYVKIGPIPKGTPINLIANLEPDFGQLAALKLELSKALLAIHARNLTGPDAVAELSKAVPALLAANKCPDFIEDEGHYFGSDLADADKRALIEFLKTL